MKKITKIISFLLVLFMLTIVMPINKVFAAESQNVYVRVDGLEGTIADGYGTGNNVYDVLKSFLDKENIHYTIEDGQWVDYVSEINNLAAGFLGGHDGWMYLVKNDTEITSERSDVTSSDEVVFYYGDYDKTAVINSIVPSKEIPEANEEFTLTLQNVSKDWTTNQNITKPLSGIKCEINNEVYTSDENGQIKLTLDNGDYTYKFSAYNGKDSVPSVVMLKGTFKIDGKTPLKLVSSDKKYTDVTNNNLVKVDIQETLNSTINYMISNKVSQWGAFSLYKTGNEINEGYLDTIKEYVDGGVDKMTGTQLESAIIGLAALGYSPYDYNGIDLVASLYNRDIDTFYNNDLIFGLLTYRALNIEEEYKVTKADLVNKILSKYNNGWSWADGVNSDPDMTASAINALAPYYNGETLDSVDMNDLKNKVDSAVSILSKSQLDNGDINGTYGASSETDAFVIMALKSIGIDPKGEQFTKANGNLVTAFLSYKGDNGAFNHDNSLKNNMYATENALRALIVLNNSQDEEVYDYYTSDINIKNLKPYSSNNSEDKKDDIVKEENKDNNVDTNKGDNNQSSTNTNNKNNGGVNTADVSKAKNYLLMMSMSAITLAYLANKKRKIS